MISKKNKLIVFIVFVVLIVLSVFFVSKRENNVKSNTSDSKKYLVSYNGGRKTETCNKYFDNIETKFYKYSEVDEGYPLFIYNHCAWNISDLVSDGEVSETNKKEACDVYKEYVNDKRISDNDEVWKYNTICEKYFEKPEDKLYVSYYDPYDKKNKTCEELKVSIENDFVKYKWIYDSVYLSKMKCPDIDGSKKYDVVSTSFDATGSYGMNCNINGVEYATETNVCSYNLKRDNSGNISGTINLPDSTSGNDGNGIIQSGTYKKFIGWSSNKNCSSIDISQEDIKNGKKTINVDNSNYVSRYYACFDNTVSDNTLDDGTIDNLTKVYNNCDPAGDYDATLTSSVRISDTYTTNNSNSDESVSGVNSGKSYTINKYCSMKCTETFEYTYPAIFETVKSGTYFELLYTPQVNATYTCKEKFNYDSWNQDYMSAIENEKKAYVDYKNIEGINAITGGTTSTEVCYSETTYYSCGRHGARCSSTTNYYYTYLTIDLYSYSDGEISTNSKTGKYCSHKKETIDDGKKDLLSKASRYSTDNDSKTLDSYGNKNKDGIAKYLDTTKNNWENMQNNRKKIEKMNNEVCYTVLDKDKIQSENYYSVNPKIKLEYDADKTINKLDSNARNVLLKSTKYYDEDTGSYSENNNYKKIDSKTNYQINYLDKTDSFNAYNYGNDKTIYRTKKMNFNFDTEYNYYTEFYTGAIYNSEKKNTIKLGNVFPITLSSSGKKNISFEIEKDDITSAVKKELDSKDTKYTCTYNVSNDAVILDKSTKNNSDDDKKYKTSFFVRPIAVNDVDPNNRLDSGLLGANWASRKGQLLIKIIENKSKGNNTYNPDNLEYSFTLNAESLDKIRDYNKNHKYDEKIDTYFECNGLGMECKSKFLNELLKGTYGNVNGSISNGRNARKYYIGGKWYSTDSLLSSKDFVEVSSGTKHSKSEVYGVCNSSCKDDDSACYECLYKKVNEGVLP